MMTLLNKAALAAAVSMALAAPAAAVPITVGDSIVDEFDNISIGGIASILYENMGVAPLRISLIDLTGQGQSGGADLALTRFGVDVTSDPADDAVVYTFSSIFSQGVLFLGLGDIPSFDLAAGDSFKFFVINDAAASRTIDVDFAFNVAAVPVPAAGALLLTALLGGTAISRRKKLRATAV